MPRRKPRRGVETSASGGRHVPVLLNQVLDVLSPKDGESYVDATFGAGGYSRAILDAAQCHVTAFDRDPTAIAGAAEMLTQYGERLRLLQLPFGELLNLTSLDAEPGFAGAFDAVVFDLGVSSMQLDEPDRGFSFQADGPLDMRMESLGLLNTRQAGVEGGSLNTAQARVDDGSLNTRQARVEDGLPNTAQARVEGGSQEQSLIDGPSLQSPGADSNPPNIGLPNVGAEQNVGAEKKSEGLSAADVVNTFEEADLADIIYRLGEEKRSRAIARAIVARRAEEPFSRTLDLANLVQKVLGKGPPGRHPATRTFQALRMFVNDELGQLVGGLAGAERALKPGGRLVVVTFHSLEDRIVKRFINSRCGKTEGVSRHMPAPSAPKHAASLKIINSRSLTSSKAELDANPRARSARLRSAVRTDAAAWPLTEAEAAEFGAPVLRAK